MTIKWFSWLWEGSTLIWPLTVNKPTKKWKSDLCVIQIHSIYEKLLYETSIPHRYLIDCSLANLSLPNWKTNNILTLNAPIFFTTLQKRKRWIHPIFNVCWLLIYVSNVVSSSIRYMWYYLVIVVGLKCQRVLQCQRILSIQWVTVCLNTSHCVVCCKTMCCCAVHIGQEQIINL